MWELFVAAAAGTAVDRLLGPFLSPPRDWRFRLFRHALRVSSQLESGPITRELGFTEKAVKVSVRNRGKRAKEIQDLRLVFSDIYGLPVLTQAPPGRTHARLPTELPPGATGYWYFPAEHVASAIGSLTAETSTEQVAVYLRPQVIDADSKVYRGPRFRFSLDVNSYWP